MARLRRLRRGLAAPLRAGAARPQQFRALQRASGHHAAHAVYYYLSAGDAQATQQQVLAYTHNDTYKPLPGYQVAVSHFHFHLNEELQDANTLDLQPGWQPVFRALGINIAILADFHGDGHANPPARFEDQSAYFEGIRRSRDRDFLVMPGEEPDAKLGGHYMFLFPHPVYWTQGRRAV